MSERNTPDIIIERAVEIWCRALARPRHDNGDNSEHGFMATGLAGMVLEQQLAKRDDYPGAIARFRTILTEKLKWLRDHDGEPTGRQVHGRPETVYFDRSLDTDYNPDPVLAEAANAAGVPLRAFSWKSHVSFYDENCVGASFGYGAPYNYHYPLSDGRWLICRLRGEDMPKIIKAVEVGMLPELTVEAAEVANV